MNADRRPPPYPRSAVKIRVRPYAVPTGFDQLEICSHCRGS